MSQTVVVQSGPVRVDQFLATVDGIKSRNVAQRLVEAGAVLRDGKPLRKSSLMLQAGDALTVVLEKAAAVPIQLSATTPLPVLFEDEHCLVVSKPAGIAVHPGNGTQASETVLDALKALFAERSLPYSDTEVLVHRLDKDTTGCLLIAKTPGAHLALQKQFADRTVAKTYLALVAGVPAEKEAVIDAPIGRHTTQRTRMSVIHNSNIRSAVTTYHTLGSAQGASLLACDLHTGRTHQIRVHLSAIGHPVLGDPTYASSASAALSRTLGIDRICLHAWKLAFDSPSGKRVSVECAVPESFSKILDSLEVQVPNKKVSRTPPSPYGATMGRQIRK